jgi:hypothetical protein
MSLRLLTLVSVTTLLATSAPSAQNLTLKTVMRNKLVNTQTLLESVGNYPAMDRAAAALSRITEGEIATWQVGAHPKYREHAISFLSAVRGIREASANRDLENALSHYADLVSSCTQCHAHVRASKTISFEAPRAQ